MIPFVKLCIQGLQILDLPVKLELQPSDLLFLLSVVSKQCCPFPVALVVSGFPLLKLLFQLSHFTSILLQHLDMVRGVSRHVREELVDLLSLIGYLIISDLQNLF